MHKNVASDRNIVDNNNDENDEDPNLMQRCATTMGNNSTETLKISYIKKPANKANIFRYNNINNNLKINCINSLNSLNILSENKQASTQCPTMPNNLKQLQTVSKCSSYRDIINARAGEKEAKINSEKKAAQSALKHKEKEDKIYSLYINKGPFLLNSRVKNINSKPNFNCVLNTMKNDTNNNTRNYKSDRSKNRFAANKSNEILVNQKNNINAVGKRRNFDMRYNYNNYLSNSREPLRVNRGNLMTDVNRMDKYMANSLTKKKAKSKNKPDKYNINTNFIQTINNLDDSSSAQNIMKSPSIVINSASCCCFSNLMTPPNYIKNSAFNNTINALPTSTKDFKFTNINYNQPEYIQSMNNINMYSLGNINYSREDNPNIGNYKSFPNFVSKLEELKSRVKDVLEKYRCLLQSKKGLNNGSV